MNAISKCLTLAVPFVFAVAVLALGPGCQPTKSTMATTQTAVSTPTDQAVMCDKCRTVWVMRSSSNFKGITTFSRKPKMVCEDCTSAAANFLKTRKLEYTCKTCGGNLEACEGHRQ